MIVLDAFAVLALLKDEPGAAKVERLIRGAEETTLTALGLAEVVDHLIRLTGADEEDAVLDIAQLGLGQPLPVEDVLAIRAGMLRARHYHRINRAVSLADCVAAECARNPGFSLATTDPHLLDLCREERIKVIPLPDSSGRTWKP